MSHAELTDDVLDELENQYPEITSIEYSCTHKHPTWAQLAYALPNLTRIEFGYNGHHDDDELEPLILDDELFTHFNKLESIEGSKYPYSLPAPLLPPCSNYIPLSMQELTAQKR